MNKQKTKAFTLVELIVVITILAILGTIAFISLNGYSKQARDSTRTSDLSTMKTSLELFNLDAGKYPETTDPFNVTYSGVTIWTQGEFGDNTTNNVDKLDKIPTDPLTEKKYTYSVTKTKQEYQLAGLLEGDDVVLNITEEVNAGDIAATAIVTGNYNGMMIKTLTGGVNCEILAIPSIISNQGSSGSDVVLGDIVTSSGFVYDRKNNLPSNYTSSKFKVIDGFDFTPNQLVVYSDSNSCNPIYDADDNTARNTLINNLKTSYSGTIIENEGIIAEVIEVDDLELSNLGIIIVNNDLGGEIEIGTPIYSCETELNYPNANFTAGSPSGENIAWQNSNNTNPCYYECNSGFEDNDCNTVTFVCGSDFTISHGGSNYTYSTIVGLDGNCWTSENMKHGTMLASGLTATSDINTIEKWCYNNLTSNCNYYGGLYTWGEAIGHDYCDDTTGCSSVVEDTNKSVCGQLGTGWTLPSNADFTALTTAGGTGWTGNKLGGIANFLGGKRNTNGTYSLAGTYGYLQSSTQAGVGATRHTRFLNSGGATVFLGETIKKVGLHVVCIKK